MHRLVDIGRRPRDRSVGRAIPTHRQQPAAEPVDRGDGGCVEVVDGHPQPLEPQTSLGEIDPRCDRTDHLVGRVVAGLERGDDLDEALTDPPAQLGGGRLGEADDAQRRHRDTELGHIAHGERAEGVGLARAGTRLEDGEPQG